MILLLLLLQPGEFDIGTLQLFTVKSVYVFFTKTNKFLEDFLRRTKRVSKERRADIKIRHFRLSRRFYVSVYQIL